MDFGFSEIAAKLCNNNPYKILPGLSGKKPFISSGAIQKTINILKETLFPDYFKYNKNYSTLEEHTHYLLKKAASFLSRQISASFSFVCSDSEKPICPYCCGGNNPCPNCGKNINNAQKISTILLERLPHIQRMLYTNISAAYDGDPAALNPHEIILSYPGIEALIYYYIAHELYKLNVPIIPRIISELAHSATGIDIHPGAKIDEYFFMDHGTGIVIGETCIIGKYVRMYQGVVLGAKKFSKDESGKMVKSIPRHPVIEDNVTIYANATILGRITIGKNSVVGGSTWITDPLPPGSVVIQKTSVDKVR